MDLTRTKNTQLLSLIKAAQAELRRRDPIDDEGFLRFAVKAAQAELRRRGRDSVTGKRLTKKTR